MGRRDDGPRMRTWGLDMVRWRGWRGVGRGREESGREVDRGGLGSARKGSAFEREVDQRTVSTRPEPAQDTRTGYLPDPKKSGNRRALRSAIKTVIHLLEPNSERAETCFKNDSPGTRGPSRRQADWSWLKLTSTVSAGNFQAIQTGQKSKSGYADCFALLCNNRGAVCCILEGVSSVCVAPARAPPTPGRRARPSSSFSVESQPHPSPRHPFPLFLPTFRLLPFTMVYPT